MPNLNTDRPKSIDQQTTKEAGRLNSIPSRRFLYPTEKPQSHLVIFDGRCVFCTTQVRILARFDFFSKLSFISLHDPNVNSWFPGLSYEQLMKQIYVIPNFSESMDFQDAQLLAADKGIRFLFLRNPIFFPIGLVMSIPFTGPVWNRMYQWVAKRRYFFGKVKGENQSAMCEEGGTCHLHFGKESNGSEKEK